MFVTRVYTRKEINRYMDQTLVSSTSPFCIKGFILYFSLFDTRI